LKPLRRLFTFPGNPSHDIIMAVTNGGALADSLGSINQIVDRRHRAFSAGVCCARHMMNKPPMSLKGKRRLASATIMRGPD
jgi:hypothetical protein